MPRKKVTKAIKEPRDSLSLQRSQISVLERHPYLKTIIELDVLDPKRFKCLICSNNQPKDPNGNKKPMGGALTWLKKHLETSSHQDFTPIEDKKLLKEAL